MSGRMWVWGKYPLTVLKAYPILEIHDLPEITIFAQGLLRESTPVSYFESGPNYLTLNARKSHKDTNEREHCIPSANINWFRNAEQIQSGSKDPNQLSLQEIQAKKCVKIRKNKTKQNSKGQVF